MSSNTTLQSGLKINHTISIDRSTEILTNEGFKVKAIIRTSIGSQRPLHPQYQYQVHQLLFVQNLFLHLDHGKKCHSLQ